MSNKNRQTTGSEMKSEQFDPFELLALLFHRWKLVFGLAFVFAVSAGVYAKFFVDPIYESFAIILPSQESQSASSAAQALASSSGFSQLLSGMGESNYEAQLRSILESKDLAFKIVRGENLLSKFFPEREYLNEEERTIAEYNLVRFLNANVMVEVDSPTIKITLRGTRPELIHEVVESYLVHLDRHLAENMMTKAKATELFIEEQIKDAQELLSEVEAEFTSTKNSEGVVALDDQTSLTFSTAARLNEMLIDKEMEIDLYKNILRDSGEISRLESEKQQIQDQIDRIVGKNGRSKGAKGEITTTLKDIPGLQVQYAGLQARYENQLKIVSLLQRQLEVAKIETKKTEPSFEVIDPAFLPLHISGPNKKLYVIIGFFLGFLIAALFVILKALLPTDVRGLPSRNIVLETSPQEDKKLA